MEIMNGMCVKIISLQTEELYLPKDKRPDLAMDELKKLLATECDYQLPDDIMDRFLAGGYEMNLDTGGILVHAGQYAPDIYIVKSGIIRHVFMDGSYEKTATFALPPTMFIEFHSFYARQPSFYQVEACCPSVVIRIPAAHYRHMIESSHEFAQWVASMYHNQFYFYELKNYVINGNAKERFNSLVNNRPEIIRNVSLKIIASYLGITQQYLSKLRKEANLI